MKKKLITGSFATYQSIQKDKLVAEVDLEQLCEVLLNWADLPTKITDLRAKELALLAGSWKHLWWLHQANKKHYPALKKKKSK